MLRPHTRAEISFESIEEIGQEGKNSKTHLVYDHQLKANLVIKTVQKSSITNIDEYFDEASTLYLSSHTNVVPIHYACQDIDAIHIAMPYYKKGSLRQRMDREFLTVREIIRYASHILSGLHNIHSKRLVHFDIKPDNILLSDQDEAMLADFGLSKQLNYSGLAGQDRFYSKNRPPEAFSGSDEFSRSFDIYQFGLTLHRMANGDARFYQNFKSYIIPANPPIRASLDINRFKYDVCNEKFPKRGDYLEHIPSRLINVITKCLKADPIQRYKSAIEVANDLAIIDGNDLDWRYQETISAERKWVKNKDDVQYELTLNGSGNATAEKKVGVSPARRIVSHCKPSLSGREIKEFLKGY